ncbi:GvpL/GvpF family gas vesicle protein [Micromonospora sp. CPCC 206060]|uniref:GvpL/GvpF family gas vesicle protein n=1 Tax=Micromonospora sp. CPCC 206060 TaxID=3122406 RepID=UPI002FF32D11
MAPDSAVWLYAVTRGVPAERLAGLAGVGGGPVGLVEAAGLVAVVGTVPLAEFGEEPLARNLENLPWLETVARAHHHVVDTVARFGPVVPTRLATVYRDGARVGAVLMQRQAEFGTALDRVAGRVEWGVKAYAVPGASATAALVPDRVDERPGLAYLRRRRAQLAGRELAQQAALHSADQVHDVLGRHAEAARRHTPQDRRLIGDTGWMVLNGAYLAAAAATAEFATVVRELADRHPTIRLELTGPWPPYSFVAVQAGEAQR